MEEILQLVDGILWLQIGKYTEIYEKKICIYILYIYIIIYIIYIIYIIMYIYIYTYIICVYIYTSARYPSLALFGDSLDVLAI